MEYEAQRQRKAAAEGKRLTQETRGWVEAQGKTVTQRSKEYAHDYRYFPEPDLPPLVIGRDWVEAVEKKLPELPEARRDRFIKEYGLPKYDADLLTESKAKADYFEDFVRELVNIKDIKSMSNSEKAKAAANWLIGPATGIMNASGISVNEFGVKISPRNFALLLKEHLNGIVSSTSGKSVLEEMFGTGKSATDIISKSVISQISDTSELEKIIAEVINSNIQPVADYRAGKETALKFLVGQVMKVTKGRANPQVVNEVLKKKLAGA
jgi:aspartyl-tRNA(Asn)/glutamyl-tRNA(Gln) amidotransferase subunit B